MHHLVKLPHNNFTYIRIETSDWDLYWCHTMGSGSAQEFLDSKICSTEYEEPSIWSMFKRSAKFEVIACNGEGAMFQKTYYFVKK